MQILSANTILYCRNWRDSLRFYRDVLQLAVSYARGDWFVELRVSEGAHLSLADAARCTIVPGEGKGLTLSFQVADLVGTHATLREAGYAPGPLSERHSWRAPYFFIHDPEGNRVEFWTPPVARSTGGID